MDHINGDIKKKSANARLDWIDMSRALAMFFVVLVHAATGNEDWWIYTVFTGPIMLPMFFAISGYLFKGGDCKKFFVHLLKKLVVPWCFLSLMWLRVVLIPFKGGEWWLDCFYNMISGKWFWYMPACIIAEIIFFYILKFSKEKMTICVGVFLCVISGFTMNYFNVGNFAMFNRALIVQAYLLCGYLFRNYQNMLLKIKWHYVLIGILCYIFGGIVSVVVLPGRKVDVHLNMYPNIPLDFFMIFLGCVLVFILANKMKHVPKILVFLGQNTLVCYFFHGKILNIIDKIFLVLNIYITPNWFWAIFETILAMFGCAVVSLVLNFFCPELVGKRRCGNKALKMKIT